MAEFALLIDGAFERVENRAEQPENIPHKNIVWLPVVREPWPEYDAKTQIVDAADRMENGEWRCGFVVRNRTAEELADMQAQEDARAAQETEAALATPLGSAMYTLLNQMRAMGGEPALTPEEFANWVKVL